MAIARHALHPVKICTGRKAFASPGQDDHTDRRIGFKRLNLGRQIGDQGIIKGIVNFRTVQRDGRNSGIGDFTDRRIGYVIGVYIAHGGLTF